MSKDTEDKGYAWKVLTSSAVSTIISRAATYPADTLKAQLQVQGALDSGSAVSSLLKSSQQVWGVEGFQGFYRGFLPTLAGVVPASAVYFWSYETAKKSKLLQSLGPASDFAVGSVAQLSAGLVFTPVDIVKERLQVHKLMKLQQANSTAILSSIVARDGFLGLLRGYWITNSVWIPWTSIYIGSYERGKAFLCESLDVGQPGELPAWGYASASGVSAAFAAMLTHPIDVVKTRYQVLTAAEDQLTIQEVIKRLWRKEGTRGFTSGLSARILQIAPSAAISWLAYEKCKRYLGTC